MIHPSDLLRSDSRSKEFAAPLHLQGDVENDWGISIFPCLAKLFNWRIFAKPSIFVALLSLIGCTQGLLSNYFRNTSDVWAKQYNVPRETIDWALYINEFFVGVLALPITYLATVTHRVVWISLLIISHGIFASSLFLSERYLGQPIPIQNSTVHLCGTSYNIEHDEDTKHGTIMAVIMVYQLFSAASSIAFFSLGLVYIDDNAQKNKSAILAIALASRQFGQQLGIYASWVPNFFRSHNIFRSFIWQGTSAVYILLGILIAMFPKILPSLLIKKLAASLLELASGLSMSNIKTQDSEGFLVSIKRILGNRIMVLSALSTVTIQTALINFGIFENYFKQSRFFISDNFDKSGYNNSMSLNLTTNLLEQPFIILCTLVTGFVVSRSRIKIKYLVLWNIVTFVVVTLLFSSYLFVKCEYEKMTQLVPSCSVDCGCSLEGTFNPVCLNGKTYYSPCHAGCTTVEQLDDYQFYKNCCCGSSEGVAIDGSCHAEKCNMIYQLTQVNNVIAEGLLSTTVVTNIIIILGSVRRADKSLALGIEMTLLSLVPFLPVRLGYEYIANKLCRYWYHGKCRIYSEQFSVFLSNATVLLMILGSVVQMFLLSTDLDNPQAKKQRIKNIDVSSNNDASVGNSGDEISDQESRTVVRSNIVSEADSAYSKDNSMDDFGSLGDDHDSDEDVAMIHQDSTEKNPHPSTVLESHM